MIIQYVRNEEKQPFGVVVATNKTSIGFSLCNPIDKWNKKIGLTIASGRANSRNIIEQLENIPVYDNDKLYDLMNTIFSVQNRAEKYFK